MSCGKDSNTERTAQLLRKSRMRLQFGTHLPSQCLQIQELPRSFHLENLPLEREGIQGDPHFLKTHVPADLFFFTVDDPKTIC